jgi:hypothetical protein
LLAHGRWFSPGTPASSTTKTGRHDISEILLKMMLNTINQIKFEFDTPPANPLSGKTIKTMLPVDINMRNIHLSV